MAKDLKNVFVSMARIFIGLGKYVIKLWNRELAVIHGGRPRSKGGMSAPRVVPMVVSHHTPARRADMAWQTPVEWH